MSVKEPEAKTLSDLIWHNQDEFEEYLHSAASSPLVKKLAVKYEQEWVLREGALAFADARVKEATDKLKIEIKKILQKHYFSKELQITLDQIWQDIQFLEEVKPTP